jgi:Gpi18-like mannosyltransferase
MVADWLLGNWLWWDGGWYLHIAQHGYSYRPHQQSSVAFFPVYPVAVRLVGPFVPGGRAVAAVVITMLSGLALLVMFQRWCQRRMSPGAAWWSVVVLAVYPYAWFLYGAAYADALFLAMTMLAFLLLEDDHPLAAGLAGMVATAARPTGVVVLVGLIAVMLHRRGVLHRVRGRIRPRDLGVGVAAIGIVGWCTWLALRFGHPFAFIETEGAKGWDRAPGVATWLKFGFFKHVTQDSPWRVATFVVQALLCLAFAAAVPTVWRRFGAGYGIYVVAAVLVPAVSTDDFMGTGRYMLAAFPVFALIGSTLAAAPRARWVYATASSAALVGATSLFATGHFLT